VGPDGHPVAVTEFSNDASPFGILQMVGNVWEFVEQTGTPGKQMAQYFAGVLKPPPKDGELWYAIRGGSFGIPLPQDVIWDPSFVPERWKWIDIGFRCAKDVK
jgi:formylglycine-generating enzyme required for sulfatase activity